MFKRKWYCYKGLVSILGDWKERWLFLESEQAVQVEFATQFPKELVYESRWRLVLQTKMHFEQMVRYQSNSDKLGFADKLIPVRWSKNFPVPFNSYRRTEMGQSISMLE